MSRAHQIHDVLRTNLRRRKDVDQPAGMRPRHRVLKGFGVNVSGPFGGNLIGKRNIPFLKDGMHPTNTDPVRAFKMTHSGVLSSADDADHGLVVVVEDEVRVFAT